MSYTSGPRGRTYIRMKAAQLNGGGLDNMRTFAAARWPAEAQNIEKAVQSALQSGDFGAPEAIEYTGVVREKSVLGGLVGIRAVPFNRRMLKRTNGVQGWWAGQAAPAPMLTPVLAGSTLTPKHVISIIVVTQEGLRAEGPAAESGLQNDTETGCIGALDVALPDPSNAGSDAMPAAITHGAPTVDATNDPVADLKALIEVFQGDLSSAYFVCDPKIAMSLALMQTPSGALAFPDCGPRGGSLAGVPLLVSRHSPRDSSGAQLALVDASSIALAMEGIELAQSENTTLVMSDTPTSPAAQVSMFQTDCVALRATIRANWELQRAGGVALLTGVTW